LRLKSNNHKQFKFVQILGAHCKNFVFHTFSGEDFIDREFVDEIILQINVVDRTTKPGKDSTATGIKQKCLL
jgi:hypothetical protein